MRSDSQNSTDSHASSYTATSDDSLDSVGQKAKQKHLKNKIESAKKTIEKAKTQLQETTVAKAKTR